VQGVAKEKDSSISFVSLPVPGIANQQWVIGVSHTGLFVRKRLGC